MIKKRNSNSGRSTRGSSARPGRQRNSDRRYSRNSSVRSRARRSRAADAAKATAPADTDRAPDARGERLQKVLAFLGVGSRRHCEELIVEGRAEVDRQVVTRLGTRVDPSRQEIRVDGEILRQPRRVYLAVHKPTGVVSTNSDPDGRMRVIDLVGSQHRLFTVGRLDKSSEGLILVTNDGELANRLTHPRYGVDKTYEVVVAGHPVRETSQMLTDGVRLAEGIARAKSVRMKRRQKHTSELEIVLNEGRNREIRRLLAHVGHKVLRLKRTAIGPLRLGMLGAGDYRPLTAAEVGRLNRATSQGAVPRRPGPRADR